MNWTHAVYRFRLVFGRQNMNKLAWTLLAGGLLLALGSARAADDEAPEDPGPGALFERLDTNGDGQLTAEEVPEEHQRLFDRLRKTADKDGDKQINRDEFAAGLADKRPRPE